MALKIPPPPPVTVETEGWIDGQALEILQPNIAHRTRLTVCVRVCDYFQSGGEVYRGRKGVFHSRWGQRGPVFLHPAELHKARYGEKKFQSSYRNKWHMFLLHKETNMYRKMVQRLVQGLCEKKCTLTKSNTLSVECSPTPQGCRSFLFCIQGQSVRHSSCSH